MVEPALITREDVTEDVEDAVVTITAAVLAAHALAAAISGHRLAIATYSSSAYAWRLDPHEEWLQVNEPLALWVPRHLLPNSFSLMVLICVYTSDVVAFDINSNKLILVFGLWHFRDRFHQKVIVYDFVAVENAHTAVVGGEA